MRGEDRLSRYQFTPESERDIARIVDFYLVEKGNARAARRIVDAIYHACERFSSDPTSGRSHPELGPGVRSMIVRSYPYRVFYREAPPVRSGTIEILRVLHQRRSVDPALF